MAERKFHKVTPRKWTGSTARALRGDFLTQSVWSYLLECPKADFNGLYEIDARTIARDIGSTEAQASAALEKLSGRGQGALPAGVAPLWYEPATELVFIFERVRIQMGDRKAKNHRWVIGARNRFLNILEQFGWTYAVHGFFLKNSDWLYLEVDDTKEEILLKIQCSGTNPLPIKQQPVTNAPRPGDPETLETEKTGEEDARTPVAQPVPESSSASDWDMPTRSERVDALEALRANGNIDVRSVLVDNMLDDANSNPDHPVMQTFEYYVEKIKESKHHPASRSNTLPRIANCHFHWEQNGIDPTDEMRKILDYVTGSDWFSVPKNSSNSTGQMFGSRTIDAGPLMDRLASAAHDWLKAKKQKASEDSSGQAGGCREKVELLF